MNGVELVKVSSINCLKYVVLARRCSAVLISFAVAACAAAPPPQESAIALPSVSEDQVVSSPDSDATFHFMLGYQAELAQDGETALREYTAALKADPTSADIQGRLAILYFGLGDLANATVHAEAAGEKSGDNTQLLTQMAGILAGAGKGDLGIKLLDQGIARAPDKGELYFSKGMILLNHKRLAEAEQSVKEGLNRNADSPAGYYYLGRISVETGNVTQALDSFERAVAENPSFEPAYLALVAFHESRQEREKAIEVLKKYLHRVNPSNREAHQHLIQLYINTKNYSAGLAELEKLLRTDPHNLDAKLRRALIYGEKKEHVKAIDELTEVLEARPAELKIRDYLGYLYEESKDYPKAMEAYQMNIQLDPTFPESRIHLGVLHYRLKQFPESISHLKEAVRLIPKQPEPHIVLGLAYLQSEHFDQASSAFEEGIRYNPTSADLHFNLGTAYDKLNRFADVVKAMESALAIDPHHADALNYLGYSYADRGIKIEEALSLTKRAVALKPENGYYVDSLGWAFYKSGMLAEALTEIKRAVTLVGDDPVIYEHLGDIYVKQRNLTEAKEAWLHSLELDPSNEKLLQRFREQGFGDPDQEDRIQRAKRRVSEKIQAQQAVQ